MVVAVVINGFVVMLALLVFGLSVFALLRSFRPDLRAARPKDLDAEDWRDLFPREYLALDYMPDAFDLPPHHQPPVMDGVEDS